MSVRNFGPVPPLPDGRNPGDRFSVTFGKHFNACPRSGYLYEKYRGGGATHAMERGSAFHRVVELATQTAHERDERKIPPDLVKAIVNEVIADPAYRCTFEEQDYLREMAYRWARLEEIPPADKVLAVETLFVLEVDGCQIRGKIDRADLIEDGAAIHVKDWKSSKSMPSYEDIGRRRPGQLEVPGGPPVVAAKEYQLVLYGLALAFGVPVRIEGCDVCGGTGDDAEMRRCAACRGYGAVEVPEPFPVGGAAQRFDLSYVYPGIEGNDGEMGSRDVSLTRLELHEYLESLRAQVAHVRHAVRTGEWDAVRGDHCAECPAKAECPLPEGLRTFAGRINTVEEAREAAEQLDAEKDIHQARWKELKLLVDTLPGQRLRFGRDQVIEHGFTESERIGDKAGMFAAVERAVQYGEKFDPRQFVKTVTSTPLRQRRLTEQELIDEESSTAEGSNQQQEVA